MDFSSILRDGGVRATLSDPAAFAHVELVHGAPTWPNGFDVCPDWLRSEMMRQGTLDETIAAE